MYREQTRALSERERSVLRESIASSDCPVTLRRTWVWLGVWSAGLLFCASVVAVLLILRPNPILAGVLGGPLAVGALICLYALITLSGSYRHWRGVYTRFESDEVPKIREALAHGAAAVKSVKATAVVEIKESEDEGPGFIFDIGDGELLVLKGQRYLPVAESMPWPNSEFEIVRADHAGIWIGVFCYGRGLVPIRAIDGADCKPDFVWDEREERVDAEIESFVESILKVS